MGNPRPTRRENKMKETILKKFYKIFIGLLNMSLISKLKQQKIGKNIECVIQVSKTFVILTFVRKMYYLEINRLF